MTLFNGKPINWTAFDEGQKACIALNGEPDNANPYEEESDDWYSWNLGWNSIM